MAALDRFPALAACLAGGPAAWPDLHIAEDEFRSLCKAEELWTLVYHRVSKSESADSWPPALWEALAHEARAQAAGEALRAEADRTAIDALARAGVQPILLKGTALAYGYYGVPAARPREDTDVLIPADQRACARGVLASLAYAESVQCSELSSQFAVEKVDGLGLVHVLDVHWKISSQPVFADVLTHTELLPRTVAVPALGVSAIAPGAVDALLLACVHPVMHHRNVERVLWVYDIHLLASALTPAEIDEFAARAREKRIAAICAHGLQLARSTFDTAVPPVLIAHLSHRDRPEPSAEYLASKRRWRHEFVASVRGLSSFGERARLLREVLFPDPRYMLASYGLRGKPLGPWLLPALYLHRNLRGAWKVASRQK